MARPWKLLLAGASAVLLVFGLAGCSKSDPSQFNWVGIAEQPIVALDSSAGVYVIVSRYTVRSGSAIDYRFGYRLENGALREDQLSSFIARLPEVYSTNFVVDIYEDATPETSRFTVLECELKESENDPLSFEWLFTPTCVTEDGRQVDYRVDLHVPAGTIQRFDSVDVQQHSGQED